MLRKACKHAAGKSGPARLRAWRSCGCAWYWRHTEGGRRVDTNLGTSDYAEAKRRLSSTSGDADVTTSGGTSVEAIADRWDRVTERRVRESTMHGYRASLRHVKAYLGNLDVRDVTAAHLAEMEADLVARGGLSPLYARNAKNVAVAILGHALDAGLVASLPRTRRRRTTTTTRVERRFLERAELARLWAVEDMLRPLFQVGAITGLRPGELLALRPCDTDARAKVIRVRRTWVRGNRIADVTKSEAGRRDVDVPDEVIEVLARCRRIIAAGATGPRRLDSKPPGSEDRYWPLHYSSALSRWHDACTLAGIARPGGLHTLRHTNAAMRIALGQDLVYVADQLGHSDAAVTLREYGHLVERERRDAGAMAVMLHDDPPSR